MNDKLSNDPGDVRRELQAQLDKLDAALAVWATRDTDHPRPEVDAAGDAAFAAMDALRDVLYGLQRRLSDEQVARYDRTATDDRPAPAAAELPDKNLTSPVVRVPVAYDDLLALLPSWLRDDPTLRPEPHRLSAEDAAARVGALLRLGNPGATREGVVEILTELELYQLGYDIGYEDGSAGER